MREQFQRNITKLGGFLPEAKKKGLGLSCKTVMPRVLLAVSCSCKRNVNKNTCKWPGSLCGGAEAHLLASSVTLVLLYCFLYSPIAIMPLLQKKVSHCFSKSHS